MLHALSLGEYGRLIAGHEAVLPAGFALAGPRREGTAGSGAPANDREAAMNDPRTLILAASTAPAALRLHCTAGLGELALLGIGRDEPLGDPEAGLRHLAVHLGVVERSAVLLTRGWTARRAGGRIMVGALPLAYAAEQLTRMVWGFAEETLVFSHGSLSRREGVVVLGPWCHHRHPEGLALPGAGLAWRAGEARFAMRRHLGLLLARLAAAAGDVPGTAGGDDAVPRGTAREASGAADRPTARSEAKDVGSPMGEAPGTRSSSGRPEENGRDT